MSLLLLAAIILVTLLLLYARRETFAGGFQLGSWHSVIPPSDPRVRDVVPRDGGVRVAELSDATFNAELAAVANQARPVYTDADLSTTTYAEAEAAVRIALSRVNEKSRVLELYLASVQTKNVTKAGDYVVTAYVFEKRLGVVRSMDFGLTHDTKHIFLCELTPSKVTDAGLPGLNVLDPEVPFVQFTE